ncbi:MAG: hypothetical protein ACTSVI_01380 [Promethearchaeota archaeon]
MTSRKSKILASILKKVDEHDDLDAINEHVRKITGIVDFFRERRSILEFKNYLSRHGEISRPGNPFKDDMGDFQTPARLTSRICHFFKENGVFPTFLLEPTCGEGNFVLSAIKHFKSLRKVACVEIQPDHEWAFKLNIIKSVEEGFDPPEIYHYRASIFDFDFSRLEMIESLNSDDLVLIMGNPPWVTNSELEKMNSSNLPVKSNFKKFKGLDSITGKSNFDIAEFIITDIIKKFSGINAKVKIAMLCKNTVIRNVIKANPQLQLEIKGVTALELDAKKEFGVSASASLFIADVGDGIEHHCNVFEFNEISPEFLKTFGWYHSRFVSDIELYKRYEKLDGKFQFEWRQGVKHDLSRIMVLKKIKHQVYQNGLEETIHLEEKNIYPFLKSSDLNKKAAIRSARYHVIITQDKIGQQTRYIQDESPRLWRYLNSKIELFNGRKSRIYKGKPPFSIFGIGDYSFKPYKVGFSGFYKNIKFSLIFPIEGKPAMLDDTCYFISFNNLKPAVVTWLLLNSEENKGFIKSLAFMDSKRPYTKEILMRINLVSIANEVNFQDIIKNYNSTLKKEVDVEINEMDFMNYKKLLHEKINSTSEIKEHGNKNLFKYTVGI